MRKKIGKKNNLEKKYFGHFFLFSSDKYRKSNTDLPSISDIDSNSSKPEDLIESTVQPNTPLSDVSSERFSSEIRKANDIIAIEDDVSDEDIPARKNFFGRVSGEHYRFFFFTKSEKKF